MVVKLTFNSCMVILTTVSCDKSSSHWAGEKTPFTIVPKSSLLVMDYIAAIANQADVSTTKSDNEE